MINRLDSVFPREEGALVAGAARDVLKILLLLVASAVALNGTAAQVDWLYEAEVVVDGQDAEQRNKGIDEAFRKVLVKVTGNRSMLQGAGPADGLGEGDRYLQQYRYRNMPRPAGSDELPDSPQRLLKVSFDPAAVDRALRDQGLPVWGANRPAVLVWLGVEKAQRRRLALPERDETLWRVVHEVARERGIPLLSPLLDLEDQSRLRVSDLWGDFESSIRQASDRYSPDAVVAGRLVKRGRSWRGHWVLYAEQRKDWESAGDTLAAAAAEGMEVAIDHIASSYVPLAGDSLLARLNLRVEDLRNLAAYGRVSTHLQSLDGVERVVLVSAEPTAATFGLEFRGGRQALEQVIALGGLLEPLPDRGEAPATLPPPGSTGPGGEAAPTPQPPDSGSGASATSPPDSTGPAGTAPQVSVLEYRVRP